MVTEKKDKPQSFEKALKRLEEMAEAMESGDLGLEKMVAAFEEGRNWSSVALLSSMRLRRKSRYW